MKNRKEKLIELLENAFKSDDFNIVDDDCVLQNQIYAESNGLASIITYAEQNYRADFGADLVNTKYTEVEDFICHVNVPGMPIIDVCFYGFIPQYSPQQYDVEEIKLSQFQRLNLFKTYIRRIYRIKETNTMVYIQSGNIREYLSINEYKDLSLRLSALYKAKLEKQKSALSNEFNNKVDEALNKFKSNDK